MKMRSDTKVELVTELEPKVVLAKLNPAIEEEALGRLLRGTRGAVLEGTGIGHVKTKLHKVVRSFGKPTVITTQVAYGGERLGTYDVDLKILGIKNLIPGRDMCSETALVKLMWALPQGGDVRTLMMKDVAGEISVRE
jgi:L-asparaginase/Glu-tRNA(Gln) amidotransferase subunit D